MQQAGKQIIDAMAKRSSRRRKRDPISPLSIAILSVSSVSIILFIIFIFSGAKGTALRVISGLSVILMISCIVSLIMGIRQFMKAEFVSFSKVLSCIMPAIAAALWLVTYFFGIIIG